jgi:hypothetical protein
MAEDGIGLLDHLGIEHAHLVGASMGGMIAQAMTIRHPYRILSLGSIMSTTGGKGVGRPALTLYPMLLRRAPGAGPDAFAEHVVRVQQLIGSPGFPFEADEVRARARRAYARGIDAAGPGRQLAAIMAARDRTADLRKVTVPTVVIHGTADRLVAPSGRAGDGGRRFRARASSSSTAGGTIYPRRSSGRGKIVVPLPSTRTRREPGMASAVARPPDGATSRSAVPWMTTVGTVTLRRSVVRSLAAMMAASWRPGPAASIPRA